LMFIQTIIFISADPNPQRSQSLVRTSAGAVVRKLPHPQYPHPL